jgi:hypothetical protein
MTNLARQRFSFDEYLLLEEVDGTWSRKVARGEETARLTSVECDLPLGEVYRNPLA